MPLGSKEVEDSLQKIQKNIDKHLQEYEKCKAEGKEFLSSFHHYIMTFNVNKLKKLTSTCVERIKEMEVEEASSRELKSCAQLLDMEMPNRTNPKYMTAEERTLYYLCLFHAEGREENWSNIETTLKKLTPRHDWRDLAYKSPLRKVLTYHARRHGYYYKHGVSRDQLYRPYKNDGSSFHRLIRCAKAHMDDYQWTNASLVRDLAHAWPGYERKFYATMKRCNVLCLLRIGSLK